MPSQELKPIMEVSRLTIGEFLGELFPGRDIVAGLERGLTVVESFAKRISSVVEPVVTQVCEVVDRLDKLPPKPGYEAMLIERGHHALLARGFSYWIFDLAETEANKAKMQGIVVDAIRFLAKPGRQKRSISRRAAVLLEVWNTTSSLGDVFDGVDVSVFEFVDALEGADRGERAACQRLTEIAASLAPGLSARRGPKASAASIAHEFSLTLLANMSKPIAYTYDPIGQDFTDRWTRATQLAFGDPDFDPRPARRRQKKRQKLESN